MSFPVQDFTGKQRAREADPQILVASEAHTDVYKQWPTAMSPAWTVFYILQTVNNQPGPRLTN